MNNYKRMAVRKENEKFELYIWGRNDGGSTGKNSLVPVKLENQLLENATKVDIYSLAYALSFIGIKTENDYRLLVSGSNGESYVTGLGVATCNNWSAITYDGQNEVKKFVNASSTSSMFFTDTNRVFGFGRKSLMGIGDESTELVQTPMELNIMDNGNKIEIDNIVAGSNFYIVIDKEGKVYGTGSNSNGILGRWIGIDRKQPNSRYKTAFEWVECPELEI